MVSPLKFVALDFGVDAPFAHARDKCRELLSNLVGEELGLLVFHRSAFGLHSLARIFEGKYAGKADVPATAYQLQGKFGGSGKTVKNALYIREFVHDLKAVSMGFTLMDDDGKLQLLCQLHLHAEGFLLNSSGHILIVIVQADLADGPYLGIILSESAVLLDQGFVHMVGIVGMAAYSTVDPVVFRCKTDACLRRFQIAGGVHEISDSLLRKICQQLRQVIVKAAVIHMGVGIKQVHPCSFRCCR